MGVFGPRAKIWARAERRYDNLNSDSQTILCCVASVGEYLYIAALIGHLKQHVRIVVSVFSPDARDYLSRRYTDDKIQFVQAPFDTRESVSTLLKLTSPDHVIISGNEFWPIFLDQLTQRKIPFTYVGLTINGDKKKGKLLIKLMSNYLLNAANLFTHSDKTAERLKALYINRSYHLRVEECIETNRTALPQNILAFISQYEKIFVFASVHKSDIETIKSLIPELTGSKYGSIIVPHHIDYDIIREISDSIELQIPLSSARNKVNGPLLLIDEVGHLQSLYAYATLCYVGGGFGEGLHSTIEPTINGVPTLIGPNHNKFPEVSLLIRAGYIRSIAQPSEAVDALSDLEKQSFNQMEALQALGYFEHLGSEDIALQIQTTLPSA